MAQNIVNVNSCPLSLLERGGRMGGLYSPPHPAPLLPAEGGYLYVASS